MRKKNIIKCIVKMNTVKAKVWHKDTNEVSDVEFVIPAITPIEKYEEENHIKVLEIINVATEKVKYEMPAEEFINIAIRVIEEGGEN